MNESHFVLFGERPPEARQQYEWSPAVIIRVMSRGAVRLHRHYRRLVVIATAIMSVVTLVMASAASGSVHLRDDGPTASGSCTPTPLSTRDALAITTSGRVVAINPTTLRRVSVADRVLPGDGVALGPAHKLTYVTALGPDGRPAIWAISVSTTCGKLASPIEADAELPAVSPDGRHLAFVMLDARSRQSGVAIVDLRASGLPMGAPRTFRAWSVPPARPIAGVALGPNASVLAVWGGFVDAYLGPSHSTVGTLDTLSAHSLAQLTPVFDQDGISIPAPVSGSRRTKPEDWQSAPVYLPNGEFLVGDGSRRISMPFSTNTVGTTGGGIRTITDQAGPIQSLAAGPQGSLAWVGRDHRLTFATDAVDLPFGPQAETPPTQSPLRTRTVHGSYTSVAWDIPTSEAPPPVPVFHAVSHLPSVVGLSEREAADALAALGLPVLVGATESDASQPAGTVLAQSPPAGDGVACQCAVTLTVAS